MALDPSLVYTLGAGLVGGGIAWGGVVASIRGVKVTQAEVKNDLKAHMAADSLIQLDLVGRLSRIEGKIDDALKK